MNSIGKPKNKDNQCSFCGKPESEVKKMIEGPEVRVCNECVELIVDIIEQEEDQELSCDGLGSAPMVKVSGKIIDTKKCQLKSGISLTFGKLLLFDGVMNFVSISSPVVDSKSHRIIHLRGRLYIDKESRATLYV